MTSVLPNEGEVLVGRGENSDVRIDEDSISRKHAIIRVGERITIEDLGSVPLIMNKAVGLSPLIIIMAMLVGYQFLGILGIIISVPVATALSIFIKDYTVKAK